VSSAERLKTAVNCRFLQPLRAFLLIFLSPLIKTKVPSQQQLRWSQLKVGITVAVATITLAVLIFLMGGEIGFFTSRITLYAYFDNTEGVKVGAPVALQGLTIGNVKDLRVVPGRQQDPVQITMQVNTKYQFFLRKDTTANIVTAGVLGESFIDLDSKVAKGPPVKDGDTLKGGSAPGLQDVVRASQTTLGNLDILVRRLDRIVAQVETGPGTLHDVISDPTLINRANAILVQIENIIKDVNGGKGTIGQLLKDDTMARKLNASLDKVNVIIDDINAGKGNAGLFLKDRALYDNANQLVVKGNKLVEDINNGKGLIGKLAKDEVFAKKLDDTIDKLSQIAAKLNDTSKPGSLGLLIQNPSVYNNTDQLLIETRNLIKALRENPKKYLTIHFKVF
jgi:phospholipid/cholesterol/gamma-HCH transport system substrate-binding protein